MKLLSDVFRLSPHDFMEKSIPVPTNRPTEYQNDLFSASLLVPMVGGIANLIGKYHEHLLGQNYKCVPYVLKNHSFLWHSPLTSWTYTLKCKERVVRRGCERNRENHCSPCVHFYESAFPMLVKTMKIRHWRRQKEVGN